MQVQGKFQLKGDHKASLQVLNTENASQWLPNQRNHNVTYVSRLQAVQVLCYISLAPSRNYLLALLFAGYFCNCSQAAVSSQVEKLAKEYPNRRVAVLAFNNEVCVCILYLVSCLCTCTSACSFSCTCRAPTVRHR